jgi:Flp pilus assembly protein TadD
MSGKRVLGRAALCLAQSALLIFGNAGFALAASVDQMVMQKPQLDQIPVRQAPAVVSPNYGEEPKSPAADLLQEAMEKYSAGDTVAAERIFKRVLLVDKNNADAYFNLGVLYEGKGDMQLALDNYTRAQALNPSDSELRDTVQSLRNKIAQERSTKIAESQKINQEKQTSQRRDSLRQIVSSASSDYKSGNFSEAVRKLEKVSSDAPNDPDVQYALGQAYKAKGETERARTAFNRALSIDPSSQLYRNAVSDLNNTVAQADRDTQIDSAPAGQITPFSGSGSESFGSNGGGRGFFDGGITAYRGGGGSRLKRAVAGGAVGAAAGALFAASTRSGLKGGALKGAILGGMLGYFSGQ